MKNKMNEKQLEVFIKIENILMKSNLNIEYNYEYDDFKGFINLDTSNTFRINFNKPLNKEIEYDLFGFIEYSYLENFEESLNRWIEAEKQLTGEL